MIHETEIDTAYGNMCIAIHLLEGEVLRVECTKVSSEDIDLSREEMSEGQQAVYDLVAEASVHVHMAENTWLWREILAAT